MSWAVFNAEQLVFENIVTINQSALKNNFQVLSECLSKSLHERLSQHEKSIRAVVEEVERIKRRLEGRELRGSEQIEEEEESRRGYKGLMGNLEKELKMIRTATQSKANFELSLEQQIQQLRRQVNNIKHNKVDLSEFTTLKEFMAQDSRIVKDLMMKVQSIKGDVKVSRNNTMDLLPHIDLLRDDLCLRVEKLEDKMKYKADIADLLKLQELIVGMIQYSSSVISKKFADKAQTKKGLVFLEKRINTVVLNLYGDSQAGSQIMFKPVKGLKNFKDTQANLDKSKSRLPAKDDSKEKYQTKPQTSTSQHIREHHTPQKTPTPFTPLGNSTGRLVTPYNYLNLQTIRLSPTPRQRAPSTSKPRTHTPQKPPTYLQTHFMTHFGQNSQAPLSIRQQYRNKFSGISNHLKPPRHQK